MAFSCRGCVAPKRFPGCHSQCPEYIEEKANYEALKAEHNKQRTIDCGIYHNRSNQVYKALKNRRK